MPRHKALTDTVLKRIKPPKDGRVDHFDAGYPGLHVRVSRDRKVWGYYCRHRGKQLRIVFDPYPAMSVADAHDAWRKARDAIAAGKDPRPVEAPAATDVAGVVREWLRRDQAKNRTASVVEKNFERYVLPHWKHLQITEIGRRECLDMIDRLVDRGKVTAARRLHAKLHRFLKWCVGRGIIEINPLQNVDKPGAEVKRDRVLTDEELLKVWNAATELGHPYGTAYKLLILTGARREEIGQLRWSEIVDGAIQLIGARTKKNAEPHTVPLSTAARSILGGLTRTGEFVSGKYPLHNWSKMKRNLDAMLDVAPWRTHDLRRTVATGLQKLGVALQVTESILGHVAGSRAGVIGIYQRHDYAEEKAAALEAWGAHVMAIVEGSERGKVLAWGR